MTFTFDPESWPLDPGSGLPVAPPTQRVRQLTGDVNPNFVDLEDEEIDALRHAFGAEAIERVAYEACSLIEAKLSRETDESGAGISTSRSQRYTQIRDIKRDLERRLARAVVPRYIGGDRAAIAASEADSSYRQPEVGRGWGRRRRSSWEDV